MLRAVASAALAGSRTAALRPTSSAVSVAKRWSGHGSSESPEEFDQRFIDFFNQEDLDGWDLRRGLTELHTFDVVPEPKVIVAALRACRRVNDYALAIRFLEAVKMKCGRQKNVDVVFTGYILKEIKPAMDELGLVSPDQMGYDKPEFFQPSPENWWEHKWYKQYGYDKIHGYEF